VSEWISVEERRPELYKDVLVTDGERQWVASLTIDTPAVWSASHPDYRRVPRNEYGAPYLTVSIPKRWMPLPPVP
jgi:Protein of unknown function (DUF551)